MKEWVFCHVFATIRIRFSILQLEKAGERLPLQFLKLFILFVDVGNLRAKHYYCKVLKKNPFGRMIIH
jgi:hypothetical protein